jgi:UDP-N-acetylmuramoyl-L-alanyl-D-glutamate--2,6-diaminopimelate ligase
MKKRPRFADLFQDFPFPFWGELPAHLAIEHIVTNSRQVRPGDLFVAIPGVNRDGHDYIPDALQRGAVAVVGEKALELPVPYVRVENARQALAYLAAAFYGHPARRLTVIGVTGTDGKTTTSNLIYQILLAAGLRAGLISTVNAVIGDQVLDTGFHVTTPDALDVQKYLAMMVEAGLTHVVLETTSHGWAQYRVDACEFDVGVVTNITHEHLDYHGSYQAYRAAKARLFLSLAETRPKPQGNPRLAVLNQDDASFEYLRQVTPVPYRTYGLRSEADVQAGQIRQSASGLEFEVTGRGWRQLVRTRLVGVYNVYNCLAAITATVEGLAISPQVAAAGIAALEGVPGRMERMDLGQDFIAIVDFAHTPNALKVALETARQMTRGRVIAVFGSAGLRDRQKRRMMAEVSAELADVTILTAEDPRTESLEAILEEMAAGAQERGAVEGVTFYRVPDRGDAIRLGVKLARPGDVLIVCGKGHEQSMCFGEIEYPWDDRQALRAALAEHLGIPGPAMPVLPTSKNFNESAHRLEA